MFDNEIVGGKAVITLFLFTVLWLVLFIISTPRNRPKDLVFSDALIWNADALLPLLRG